MPDPHPIEPAREPQAFRLPDGACVTVRAIRPGDGAGLQAYLRGLSDESRRNRFLGAVSELAPTELDRLTRMDRPDGLALVAVEGASGDAEIIAEAVQATAPGSARCEIALSVGEAWRRRGLGTLLLRDLECRARSLGARILFGEVLRTNVAMKGLARKAGFAIRTPFTDARLIEIVKDLLVPQVGRPCSEPFAALPSALAFRSSTVPSRLRVS
jgi:GNAT superfamily N-acetyltransferase